MSTQTLCTFPSIATSIFDVPEPEEVDGKFIYNYFIPNERESSDTYVSEESFAQHGEKYAREVHLAFKPIESFTPNSDVLTEIQLSDTEKERILNANIDKIVKEVDFGSGTYMSIQLQDSDASVKLLAEIEATLLQKKISTTALSPMETILKYSSETSDRVSGQAVLDSVSVDDLNEYVTIDPKTGEPFEITKAGDISKFTFNMVTSQRFAFDIANAAVKTPLSPASDLFSGVLSDLQETQRTARTSHTSTSLKVSNFQEVFDPVFYEPIAADSVFLGGNTIMGYRVRRSRLDSSEDDTDFFVTNTSASGFVDTTPMYGAKYSYAISAIYMVKLLGYRDSTLVSAGVLVESRESPNVVVACVESTPPAAPAGLEFYMLESQNLVIEWDFPLNPQEDIKRFQIFRRKTIHDPFVLIGELDFDDSTIKTSRLEVVNSYVRQTLDKPITTLVDNDFTVDTQFIYAVCALDAHDYSSGYSEQFSVKFNKFSAALEVELIARENAPKPYPNFTLLAGVSQDSIQDSEHSEACLYFDPEYLKVIDNQGEDQNHLTTSETDVAYKLQLIHLNLQQSVVANINVKR
jgi:hypothetical protein